MGILFYILRGSVTKVWHKGQEEPPHGAFSKGWGARVATVLIVAIVGTVLGVFAGHALAVRFHVELLQVGPRLSVSGAITVRSFFSLRCAAARKEGQRSGGRTCVTSAPRSPASRPASSDR